MNILDEIIRHKREEVAQIKAARPLSEVLRNLDAGGPVRDFQAALLDPLRPAPRLIAEIKRRSPSKGDLLTGLEPASLARLYERHGASAISVLTDGHFFGGSLEDLAEARGAVQIPVLRKEFVVDDYQIYEARRAGADAVLLIEAVLAPSELRDYLDLCSTLDMSALVEVHNARQLETALECGAEIIGINNRDLRTFTVDLDVTTSLLPLIPPGVMVVSESGIDAAGREYMGEMRVDAILVGESLITASDIAAAVRQMSGMALDALEGAANGCATY